MRVQSRPAKVFQSKTERPLEDKSKVECPKSNAKSNRALNLSRGQSDFGLWTLDFGLWTLDLWVLSLDHCAGATPASIEQEVREGVAGRRAFVVRPVYKHRPPNYVFARDKAPEATVFAVLTIIAHDKVFVLGH